MGVSLTSLLDDGSKWYSSFSDLCNTGHKAQSVKCKVEIKFWLLVVRLLRFLDKFVLFRVMQIAHKLD